MEKKNILIVDDSALMRRVESDIIKSDAREGFSLPAPIGDVPEGEKTLWPFEYGTDGFYICRMRKS